MPAGAGSPQHRDFSVCIPGTFQGERLEQKAPKIALWVTKGLSAVLWRGKSNLKFRRETALSAC